MREINNLKRQQFTHYTLYIYIYIYIKVLGVFLFVRVLDGKEMTEEVKQSRCVNERINKWVKITRQIIKVVWN